MSDDLRQYRPASITLVRYGESESNLYDAQSIDEVPVHLRGTPNHKVPLTKRGLDAARVTGKALAERFPKGFDYVYVSPYRRTCETQAALFEGFRDDWRTRLGDHRTRRDILLREQDFGYADIVAAPERTAEHFEQAHRRFEAHKANAGKFYTRPENGESWADVCQRTYMFLGKLFQPNRDRAHILVISHAVTIATFAFHLQRLDEDGVIKLYRENRINNCGVGRFESRPVERPRWVRTLWNEVMC